MIGCGAELVPWAGGAPLAELRLSDGRWVACAADRFPQQLIDAIKKYNATVYIAPTNQTLGGTLRTTPIGNEAVVGVSC